MKLLHVEKRTSNDKVRLVGIVQMDSLSQEIELYFEYPQRFADFVIESADAFVPALLLPAMERGENLDIKPPISEKLLLNSRNIQDIIYQWYPETFKKVTVSAERPTKYEPHTSNQVGAFFSLGVDSFYTFHKHLSSSNPVLPHISHLIHMKGIEFPLHYYRDNQEQAVNTRIKDVAKETGIDVIFGETNIRTHFPLKWGQHYHGAGLASVALSLSGGLKSVLIPSTDSYKTIFHWGSSPLFDHWWSTEKTSIFHDGSEVERAEKTAKFLPQDALAKKYLRVCLKNYGSETNCGRCTKCVRTMLPLYVSGQLSMFKTFPDQLPKDWTKILHINDEHDLSHAEAILELGKEYNGEPKVLTSLSRKIELARYAIFFKQQNLLTAIKSIIFVFLIQPIIQQVDNLLGQPQIKRLQDTLHRLVNPAH
ncbi:MAG: hypothetical protein F6K58_05020 [Symploca sp. SIO2E9]|nr:hypothetical protein [Symploca sp. SIO2E9]